jgi:heme a synthase
MNCCSIVRTKNNPWLHRFAVLLAVSVLGLLCVGGLVTSHGAGMAVPDWPNTFGYNMFFFPISKWVGGIFYEHSHRLFASGVGFLTIILAAWLWIKEERRWLRWLGVFALFAVVLQGVLGGLRVVWMKDQIGIFHAALAQVFFCLVCAIGLFSARWWTEVQPHLLNSPALATVRKLAIFGSILIFLQLLLGATMRHQHAGLAIPDFPAAYGRFWPATDADSVTRYNQLRTEVTALGPITSFQIWLQMAHRFMAVTILIVVGCAAIVGLRLRSVARPFRSLLWAWSTLIFIQVGLGAATIWTNKSADVATAHVAVGGLSLATAVLLVLMSSRVLRDELPSVETERAPVQSFAQRQEVPA